MALDRRGFMKFVAGGTAGILVTPLPWKLLDDLSIWSQNWSWIPKNQDGANAYIMTTSKLCPSCTGMKVRTVNGRPVRTVSAPEHPLSLGGISSVAAAEVQMLYSPARMKRPLIRKADGAYVATTWDAALALLQEKLATAGKKENALACLSGDANGTINEVFSAFLDKAQSDKFFLMPTEAQASAKAWKLMGGKGQVGYAIEESDYVFALGANVLESWGTVIRNRAAFGKTHPHGAEPTATYVYAGPVQKNTAAGADKWLPILPGTEAVVALGIANLLIKAGAQNYSSDFGDFKNYVASFTPAKVAELSGISEKALKEVAAGLAKAKKPLVLTGSEFTQGAGAATFMAGFALNMLLPNACIKALPVTGKVLAASMTNAEMLEQDFVAYLARVNAGKIAKPEVMMFYEANPVYALPQADDMAKVLKDVPFKVAFTSFLDETALTCDLVLPVPMGLERMDDVNTPYGAGKAMYALTRPVVPPLVDARPTGDVMLGLAEKLGFNLGYASFEDILKAKARKAGADFDALLEDGLPYENDATESLYGMQLRADVLKKAVSVKPVNGIALAPVFKLNYGTSKTAVPPFNVKTLRADELIGDDGFVMMNGVTAKKLGVQENSVVMVSGKSASFAVRVNIFEGVMTNTVAVPLGLGHTAFDEFSKNKGANVMQLLIAGFEPATGVSVWTQSSVSIAKA